MRADLQSERRVRHADLNRLRPTLGVVVARRSVRGCRDLKSCPGGALDTQRRIGRGEALAGTGVRQSPGGRPGYRPGVSTLRRGITPSLRDLRARCTPSVRCRSPASSRLSHHPLTGTNGRVRSTCVDRRRDAEIAVRHAVRPLHGPGGSPSRPDDTGQSLVGGDPVDRIAQPVAVVTRPAPLGPNTRSASRRLLARPVGQPAATAMS